MTTPYSKSLEARHEPVEQGQVQTLGRKDSVNPLADAQRLGTAEPHWRRSQTHYVQNADVAPPVHRSQRGPSAILVSMQPDASLIEHYAALTD